MMESCRRRRQSFVLEDAGWRWFGRRVGSENQPPNIHCTCALAVHGMDCFRCVRPIRDRVQLAGAWKLSPWMSPRQKDPSRVLGQYCHHDVSTELSIC